MKLEIRFEMRQFKDFIGAIFISDIFAENTGCDISIVWNCTLEEQSFNATDEFLHNNVRPPLKLWNLLLSSFTYFTVAVFELWNISEFMCH